MRHWREGGQRCGGDGALERRGSEIKMMDRRHKGGGGGDRSREKQQEKHMSVTGHI